MGPFAQFGLIPFKQGQLDISLDPKEQRKLKFVRSSMTAMRRFVKVQCMGCDHWKSHKRPKKQNADL